MKKPPWNSSVYDKVIAAFSEPVIVIDEGGTIVQANQALLDLISFNPVDENIAEFIEKVRLESTEQSGAVIKSEITEDAVFRFRDKAGTVKFFSCSGTPEHPGEIREGAVLVWHDITAIIRKKRQLEKSNRELVNQVNGLSARQKKTDKQILNVKEELNDKNSQIMISNKLLEIIFSNTHFLIAYLTPDFYFIQVNDAYARAFKQKPGFFVNKNYFDLFRNVKTKAIFENVVKTGNSYITYADQFFLRDQSGPAIAYWDWSLQAIKDKLKVNGIILVQIDVTRRKKAEENLLNAKRLSDIGRLAATVAHELRNPLGVIQAAIYNIKKKRLNPDIDKHIENIEAVIEESEQIINNLLSYSQFKIPTRIEVPVYSFLHELCNDIRSKNLNHEVNLITKYERLKEEIVYIDPLQIREVLNNIVNNAYQALPRFGGCIEIYGRLSSNNYLELSVTDNGDGIDKETLAKIFDPFFTCRSTGTGLGLTICKELIELHNGKIEVQSRKGQGTSVNIFLPLEGME